MQTLQHEVDQSQQDLTPQDHPVLNRFATDQSAAHLEEVQMLRQRVAVLEAALEAAQGSASGVPSPATASEFAQSLEPAVVPVEAAPASNPGFAQAWQNDDAVSFEERVAEKAFFRATSVDEQSRSWLLKD